MTLVERLREHDCWLARAQLACEAADLLESQAARIAELESERDAREGLVCDQCIAGSGWCENAVEGRYPCTCMTEAEPYQLLQQELAALRRKIDEAPVVAWSHNCSDNSDVEFFTVSLESDHPLAVHNGSHPLISKEDLQK